MSFLVTDIAVRRRMRAVFGPPNPLYGVVMNVAIRATVIAAGLLVSQCAFAQAPAGSTGQCKDGTYTSSASKSGACRGHQGVKEWYATASSAPAAPAAGATSAKPATTTTTKPATAAAPAAPAAAPAAAASTASAPAKPAKTSTATMAQAPGGGPGMVWLNTDSNVYHCSGTQYYGKTKQGAYMSEADAKAKGAHADHNHPCTK